MPSLRRAPDRAGTRFRRDGGEVSTSQPPTEYHELTAAMSGVQLTRDRPRIGPCPQSVAAVCRADFAMGRERGTR